MALVSSIGQRLTIPVWVDGRVKGASSFGQRTSQGLRFLQTSVPSTKDLDKSDSRYDYLPSGNDPWRASSDEYRINYDAQTSKLLLLLHSP